MKDFDLEAAKAGKAVITRCGYPVRILCYDILNTGFPIVAAIQHDGKEVVERLTAIGRYHGPDGSDSKYDLFMAPERKYGAMWVNPNDGLTDCTQELYDTVAELKGNVWSIAKLPSFKIVEFEV